MFFSTTFKHPHQPANLFVNSTNPPRLQTQSNTHHDLQGQLVLSDHLVVQVTHCQIDDNSSTSLGTHWVVVGKLPVKLKLENGESAEQGKDVNRERTNEGQLNR